MFFFLCRSVFGLTIPCATDVKQRDESCPVELNLANANFAALWGALGAIRNSQFAIKEQQEDDW